MIKKEHLMPKGTAIWKGMAAFFVLINVMLTFLACGQDWGGYGNRFEVKEDDRDKDESYYIVFSPKKLTYKGGGGTMQVYVRTNYPSIDHNIVYAKGQYGDIVISRQKVSVAADEVPDVPQNAIDAAKKSGKKVNIRGDAYEFNITLAASSHHPDETYEWGTIEFIGSRQMEVDAKEKKEGDKKEKKTVKREAEGGVVITQKDRPGMTMKDGRLVPTTPFLRRM
jgi:hypothetical protein